MENERSAASEEISSADGVAVSRVGAYSAPKLTVHGSVAELTHGFTGSKPDNSTKKHN